ncbi:MAG: GNAT family N-acetyltransferase [Candidatus Baltobacteraceae bacterium]
MEITTLDVRDDDALHRFTELLAEYDRSLPADLRHGSEPDRASVRAAYDRPHAAFVAKMGGAAAGCVATAHLDASAAIIQRLYIKPEYQQHGIARELVAAALKFCHRQRYGRVVLDTEKDRLPAAYRLYRSFGFEECEPYGAVWYQNATFMQRLLL